MIISITSYNLINITFVLVCFLSIFNIIFPYNIIFTGIIHLRNNNMEDNSLKYILTKSKKC